MLNDVLDDQVPVPLPSMPMLEANAGGANGSAVKVSIASSAEKKPQLP